MITFIQLGCESEILKVKGSLIIGSICLVALVGCSSSKDSALQPSPAGSPVETVQSKAEAMKEKINSSTTQGGFTELKTVLAQTKAAVSAGDFTKASAEFDKFEGSWSTVEDGVKAKSRDGYNRIEEGMDAVKSAVKASKSDQAIAALDALNQNVTSVAKECGFIKAQLLSRSYRVYSRR